MWITQDIFSQVPARFQPVDNSQVVLRFCPGYSHARKQPKSFVLKPQTAYSQIHTPYCECDENLFYISLCSSIIKQKGSYQQP